MRYSMSILPVCEECATGNLTKSCEKCGVDYCKHFSSNIDVRFCGNCMEDFRVVESVVTKVVEHLDDKGQVTSRRRSVCKSLSLQGTDWLFTTHKIQTLTDEELMFAIEYHKEVASQMMQEKEERRIERYAKLSQVKLNFGPRAPHDSTGAIKAQKPVKRTKTTKQPTNDAITAAFATLLGTKLTPEQLANLMSQIQAKPVEAETIIEEEVEE